MANGAGNNDTWSQRFNAYGALIVTAIIFGLFATHASDDTMKALAMLAGSYWLGSSNSSQKKDDTIAAVVNAPNGTGNGNAPVPAPAAAVPPPKAPPPVAAAVPPPVPPPPPQPQGQPQ